MSLPERESLLLDVYAREPAQSCPVVDTRAGSTVEFVSVRLSAHGDDSTEVNLYRELPHGSSTQVYRVPRSLGVLLVESLSDGSRDFEETFFPYRALHRVERRAPR
jgi:hypothetical protein